MTDLNQLVKDVIEWGNTRNITGPNAKATLLTQLAKSQEELTETRDAAVMWSNGHDFMRNKKGEIVETKLEIKDGIGDDTVTLILAAELAGLNFADCLQSAYDEIKNRKGKIIDGQFVKEVQP